MSIQQKVIGACHAALLVAVGVVQLQLWLAIGHAAHERSTQPAQLAQSAQSSHTATHLSKEASSG